MFAFSRKVGDPLPDVAFAAAIHRVSLGGAVHWGLDHLYYEACRRIRKRTFPFRRPGGRVAIDRPRFDRLWDRWTLAHGTPQSLIVPERGGSAESEGSLLPPDATDYSFERVVVTDSSVTVRLLLANRFHVDNRCAVLSLDGGPLGVFDRVLAMLRKAPQLHVLAAHDASSLGFGLKERLVSRKEWFRDQVMDGRARVVDIGLRPQHVTRFRGSFLPADRQAEAVPGLSRKQAAWMAHHRLELAAVPPVILLRRLQAAFTTDKDAGWGFDFDPRDFEGGDDGFG